MIEPVALYTTPKLREEVSDDDFTIPIGVSDVKREGKDVTLVTYGEGLLDCMQAADKLAKQGVEAEIVDLRTLQPLDMGPVIESFKKTNKAVVVEYGHTTFGIGGEIVAQLQEHAFDYIDAPIKRVGQLPVPAPYSGELEQAALPDPDKVVAAVMEVL